MANSTITDAARVPLSDGLRLRLWLIVFVALLPVAVLSIWQGVERLRLDVAEAHREKQYRGQQSHGEIDENALEHAGVP